MKMTSHQRQILSEIPVDEWVPRPNHASRATIEQLFNAGYIQRHVFTENDTDGDVKPIVKYIRTDRGRNELRDQSDERRQRKAIEAWRRRHGR